MSKIKLILFTSIILFSSCEKVIELDLQNSEPILVIEANLIAGENDFTVKISKSTDFFIDEPQEVINDASVILYDENGIVDVIPSKGNGIYSSVIQALEETEYRLEVEIEGIIYEATSYLAKKVLITDSSYEFQQDNGPLSEGYVISISFSDPLQQENFYRLALTEDGTFLNSANDLQVFDDRLFDGGQSTLTLARTPFDPGKSIDLELRSLNEKGYNYFNSLSATLGADGGPRAGQAAPGNPNSNWNTNILGHFTAYSADTITIELPE